MANITPIKALRKSTLSSPIVQSANKIVTSPTFNSVKNIDFDKKFEFERFTKFIRSSTLELSKIKLDEDDVKSKLAKENSDSGGMGLLQKLLIADVLKRLAKKFRRRFIPRRIRARLRQIRMRLKNPYFKLKKFLLNRKQKIKDFLRKNSDDLLKAIKKSLDDLGRSLKNSLDDLIKSLKNIRKIRFKNIKPVKTNNIKINSKGKTKGKFNFKKFFNKNTFKNLKFSGAKDIVKGGIIGIIIGAIVDSLYAGLDEVDAQTMKALILSTNDKEKQLLSVKEHLDKVSKAQNWKENNPNLYKLQQALTFVTGFITGQFKTDTDVTIDKGLRLIELLEQTDAFEEGELTELLNNPDLINEKVKGTIVTDEKEIRKILKMFPAFEPFLETDNIIKNADGSYTLEPKEINDSDLKIDSSMFNFNTDALVDFDYEKLSSFNTEEFPGIFQGGDTNIFFSQGNNQSNQGNQSSSTSTPPITLTNSVFDIDFSKLNSLMMDDMQLLKYFSGN